MQRGRGRFWRIFLAILILLVLLAGVYFCVKFYSNWRGKRNLMVFEQGFQYGYTQAVYEIINVSKTCQPFPVYMGNESINLISVDCLS